MIDDAADKSFCGRSKPRQPTPQRGAKDCGEYRQAAGVVSVSLKDGPRRSVELAAILEAADDLPMTRGPSPSDGDQQWFNQYVKQFAKRRRDAEAETPTTRIFTR